MFFRLSKNENDKILRAFFSVHITYLCNDFLALLLCSIIFFHIFILELRFPRWKYGGFCKSTLYNKHYTFFFNKPTSFLKRAKDIILTQICLVFP